MIYTPAAIFGPYIRLCLGLQALSTVKRAELKSRMAAINVNVADPNWRALVKLRHTTYVMPFVQNSGAGFELISPLLLHNHVCFKVWPCQVTSNQKAL